MIGIHKPTPARKPQTVVAKRGLPPSWSVKGMTTKRLQEVLLLNREYAHKHPGQVYACLALARSINAEITRRLEARAGALLRAKEAFNDQQQGG